MRIVMAMLSMFALLVLTAPVASEAMTVTIQATRGTSTPASATPTLTFTDSAGNPAVALACTLATQITSTAICSRTLSVGGTTVTIRDDSTTNRARVYRVDGLNSDILNLAGLKATSGSGITATTPVTLKITYSSALNEFTSLKYNLYPYTAAMSGNFLNASGGKASACASTIPCLTLKLTANNVTVNQFGDNAVATVNVPPIDSVGGFGPPTQNPSMRRAR